MLELRLMDFKTSKRRLVRGSVLAVALISLFSYLAIDGANPRLIASAQNLHGTYTTTFPLTQNPISEGGNWIGGSTAGGNLWGNVQTTPGKAFGVNEPTTYGDPTAILTGSWGPNQTVQGTMYSTGNINGTCCHEIELRLRMTISSTNITGYEAYCSVLASDQYCHIARWNGPNGSYCNIADASGYAANGDVLKATVTGTNPVVVTMYRNGSQIMQVSDNGSFCGSPFTSGAPGFGFYDDQGDGLWANWGFTSYSATDGGTTSSGPGSGTGTPTGPAAPTSVSAVVN